MQQTGSGAVLPSGRLGAWTTALALSLSGFTLTLRLAPYSTPSALVAYIAAFACVVASVLAVAATIPLRSRACAVLAVLAAAGLCALFAAQRAGALPQVWAPCVLVVLLALGSALGGLVGAGIEAPGHLLFVAIVSSLADIASVTQPEGPSAQIVQHPEALALLALPWPLLGSDQIAPVLGVGDIVFTALYASATRKHALHLPRTLLGLGAGYVLTLLSVVVLERPIPALPLLGLGALIAQPAMLRPPAKDLRRGLWVMTAFASLFAFWLLRRAL